MANWYEDENEDETTSQRHSRERNEAHDRHELEHADMNARHEAELTQMAQRQNAERAITPDDEVSGGQTAEPSNLSPGLSDWSPNLIDQRMDVRRMAYLQATTPDKLTLETAKTDGGRTPRFKETSLHRAAPRPLTPDDLLSGTGSQ